jgi:hypothetical protein
MNASSTGLAWFTCLSITTPSMLKHLLFASFRGVGKESYWTSREGFHF